MFNSTEFLILIDHVIVLMISGKWLINRMFWAIIVIPIFIPLNKFRVSCSNSLEYSSSPFVIAATCLRASILVPLQFSHVFGI